MSWITVYMKDVLVVVGVNQLNEFNLEVHNLMCRLLCMILRVVTATGGTFHLVRKTGQWVG